jgi:exopolysaccharide biosynthesis polyprenyl glycosylphosphotransferase
MVNKRGQDFLIPMLTLISDAAAIEASFLFSYWLRFFSPFTQYIPISYGLPPLEEYIKSSLVVIPIWLLLFHNRRLYRPRRASSFSDEFFAVARILFLGMLVIMAGAFVYRAFSYSRVVFGIIGVTAVVFVSVGRFAIMKFEQWWYSKGHDLKSVIIIGTSNTANKVFQSLTFHRFLGYQALGYCSISGNTENAMPNIPCLGSISSVPDLIKSHNIDVVLIALNEEEHSHLRSLVRDCQGLNVEMMMVPDILELMTSLVQIKHIEGIPFMGIKSPALSTWNSIMKRIFDIVFASSILFIASPLLLTIAIIIKLDSKGPLIYFQERIGLYGEVFRVFKFRSMRTDAEQATGPVWSKKNDLRATRIGRILRRLSLDELPQLINVINGDMSNGLRGNASITERTKYDIYYIENWSLTFDLKIIFKTIHAVLFGNDAY